MAGILTDNVLTLQEAARYLKISEEKIEKQALQGKLPGRKIDDEWRFLRTAIDEWLRSYDARAVLLNQSGCLKADENMDELLGMIYSERGRSEVVKITSMIGNDHPVS